MKKIVDLMLCLGVSLLVLNIGYLAGNKPNYQLGAQVWHNELEGDFESTLYINDNKTENSVIISTFIKMLISAEPSDKIIMSPLYGSVDVRSFKMGNWVLTVHFYEEGESFKAIILNEYIYGNHQAFNEDDYIYRTFNAQETNWIKEHLFRITLPK